MGAAGMTGLVNPSQIILGLVCILLLGAIGYEVAAPLPEPQLPPPVAAARPIATAPLAVFHPPPSESFDEINARPVFDRARAPVAEDTSTTIGSFSGTSTTPPAVSLIGIIIDGARRIAMIRSTVSPVATSVSIGDAIEGWKVVQVDPDRIVLRSGSDNAEIRLTQNRSPAMSGPTTVISGGLPPGMPQGAPAVPASGPVASPPDRTPH
jgi:hypothetical protein